LLGGWKGIPEAPGDNWSRLLDHYNRVPAVSTAIDLQVDECLSEDYKLTAIRDVPQDTIDSWERDTHFRKKLRESLLGRLIYGNWYIHKDYDPRFYGGRLPNLQGVPPWTLDPIPTHGNQVAYFQESGNPNGKTYSFDEIAFIRGDNVAGSIWGKGLIAAANTEIEFKRLMEEQQFNIHRQYAHPIFLLMPSEEVKNIASGDMTTMMKRFDSMNDEKTRIVGLPNSMTLQIIGVERKIPEAFIAWVTEHNDTQLYIKLRVPPVMLERGQNATEATAKVQISSHNRYIKSLQDEHEDIYNADILLDRDGQPFAELEMFEPKEPSMEAGAAMKQGQEQGKPGQKGQPSQEQKQAASDWMRIQERFKVVT
jgi:hypothetical protein